MLNVENLLVKFGGLVAVNDVSFRVKENEILSVIGPNGAGKTTILNAITGGYSDYQGEIIFQNDTISGLPPHEIARRGIARTFQKTNVFGEMTVLENVITASNNLFKSGFWQNVFSTPLVRTEEKHIAERAKEIVKKCGLEKKENVIAQYLPYGEGRLLEIAIAMATQPTLLLLDEPAAGMNPVETNKLIKLIADIKRDGFSILLVEHDMSVVMSISDYIIVLNFGDKIAEGLPNEISETEEVIEAYLGTKDFKANR